MKFYYTVSREAEQLFPTTSGVEKSSRKKRSRSSPKREKKGKKRAHHDRSPSAEPARIYKK